MWNWVKVAVVLAVGLKAAVELATPQEDAMGQA